ncbi:MAG: hypothetical protein M1833_007384 [Piccolia ochrophora]|nr:MAG: hypothetical protein M1833_007384 [Piccolia ochrophora]
MPPLRPLRWSGYFITPRSRPCTSVRRPLLARPQSSATQQFSDEDSTVTDVSHNSYPSTPSSDSSRPLTDLPSPPPSLVSSSAKLSALHARLSLPEKFPLTTLSRTLIHPTADPHPSFNNASLAHLGQTLMGYYISEHLICHYPRLPMVVLFAACTAYIGPETLTALTREFGVEPAAEPGGEVDPGLLQFARRPPGKPTPNIATKLWRRGLSSQIATGAAFADQPADASPSAHASAENAPLTEAAASFVRALFGALYLHTGLTPTKQFFASHILSRHLSLSSLFSFRQPTRDLSRLCAREGFDAPVARLISETGRLSRHPVFVVGVYSGQEKLGEGAGASLDEARTRAAVTALMGWYLYSPLEVRVPSETQEKVARVGKERPWEPVMIDGGEVIV